MKRLLVLLITISLLAACSPTQANPSPSATLAQEETPMQDATPSQGGGLAPIYAPRVGDDALARGNAFIDSADILIMESNPPQFAVVLKGGLPTPCNELRVVYNPPNAENKIELEVYSVVDPGAICAQVVQPFEQNISLGSFSSGHYTVWVNGEQVAEFDA